MPEARIKPNALSDRILQKPKIHALYGSKVRLGDFYAILANLKSQDIVYFHASIKLFGASYFYYQKL